MTEAAPGPSGTEITISLDAVRGEVSKFDRIRADLADLERAHPKDVVYDVTSPLGMEEAVVARRAWREPRIAVEKARKAAKAPVLELGRTIDRFAGTLEDQLRAGEDHYDGQIKAEEGRKEAERQRRLQVEAERIAAIRRRIVEIFASVKTSAPPGSRPTAAQLLEVRERLEAEPVDDSYGDLKIEAQETKVQTLAILATAIDEQRAVEAEQEKLAAERAAFLEEQRAETARRAAERVAEDARLAAVAEESLARVAKEAEALATQREENARQQAQIDAQRAELDRREAEGVERDRARQAAERAEQERVLAEESAARIAEQLKVSRLQAAAGPMLDCLRQWKAGELAGDATEIDNARAQRDAFVFNLSDVQP